MIEPTMIVVAVICFFAPVAIPACSKYAGDPKMYKTFKLFSGDIVQCKIAYVNDSGGTLKDCMDGNEYYAQTNIVEIKTEN